jgi:hypothetical protein
LEWLQSREYQPLVHADEHELKIENQSFPSL